MILLDTHVVVWLAESPEMLSQAAEEAIRHERHTGLLGISGMTLLELAKIISDGKLKARTSVGAFLEAVERRFHVFPVTGAIAELATKFSPVYPKDPVDRVIGATALAHGCRLVTRDGPIRASREVDCVW